MKKPLIVLTGPTAVGKTSLSIALARAVEGEIISADSMQVYKHMDIGSAKIKKEEMEGIPHYLIDVLEPGYTRKSHSLFCPVPSSRPGQKGRRPLRSPFYSFWGSGSGCLFLFPHTGRRPFPESSPGSLLRSGIRRRLSGRLRDSSLPEGGERE